MKARRTYEQQVGPSPSDPDSKGIVLYAHDPAREAGGGIRCVVQLWNGEALKYENGFLLTSEKSRREFITKAAAAEPTVKPEELEAALRELSGKIRQDLDDRDEQELQELEDGDAGGSGGERGRGSATGRLVHLVVSAGVELFHSDDRAFASIPVNGHTETWPLTSKGFRRWMKRLYYEVEDGGVPNSQAVQDALGVLDAKAFYEGPNSPVFVRISEQIDGAIYLDLGNEDWDAVKITADGWYVVKNPPVRFLRTKGMQALPYPVKGGSVSDLRPFVNVEDEEDFILVVAWAVGAFCPHGAKVGIELCGGQGSCKTTTARVLRRLIDPNLADLRSAPKEEGDLMIAAAKSLVIGLDNLTHIPQWLSDALCRLATGSALSKRELYTDDDEVLLIAKRPVVVTGIGETVNEPDLVDRYIKILLRVLGDDERKSEEEFWSAFGAALPGILGAILDAVVSAVKNLPNTQLKRSPRMVDFARWGTAAEVGLGWAPGTLLRAYGNNRAEAIAAGLEASPIGHLVVDFVKTQPDGQWAGTMKELLQELNERVGEAKQRPRDWPKTPRALSSALRRVAPCLRAERIVYTPPPKKQRKEKPIHTLTLADIEEGPMSGAESDVEEATSGTKPLLFEGAADMADMADVVTPSVLKEPIRDTSLFDTPWGDGADDDDLVPDDEAAAVVEP